MLMVVPMDLLKRTGILYHLQMHRSTRSPYSRHTGLAPPITAPLVLAVSNTNVMFVISITITFASQVSSDVSSGRRPTSKSDELCDANVIVRLLIEPQRCENTDFAVE